MFALTVPLTRLVIDGMSPVFLTSARAVVAAGLATAFLYFRKQPIPTIRQFVRLFAIGAGIVVGFPLFTGLALQAVPASHAAVVIGLLPAATAVISVLLTKEHPPVRFWIFAIAGAIAVIVFTATSHGGFGTLQLEDFYLLAAVVVTAYGYAEGGIIAREIGSWQTISWTLVVWSPILAVATVWSLVNEPLTASPTDWMAFAYMSCISMYFAFFAWYRGLAIGPVPIVSQVQLAQPVMSILWATIILGEVVTLDIVIGGAVVIACATLAVRTRLVR